MGYGDYYWGLCRDYKRDPFPHSLRTRQNCLALREVGLRYVRIGFAPPAPETAFLPRNSISVTITKKPGINYYSSLLWQLVINPLTTGTRTQ